MTQRGVAGLDRARFEDEGQVEMVLPDGSWAATTGSALTGRLLGTWNSGNGVRQPVSRYPVRLQPDPAAPMVQLSQVLPSDEADAAWEQQPWK